MPQGCHQGRAVVAVYGFRIAGTGAVGIQIGPAEGRKEPFVGRRTTLGQGPYRAFDGEAVVVEDEKHVGGGGGAVVEGFKDQASRKGAVAYHRYAVADAACGRIRPPIAHRGRQGR